jgi:hypothetical protein
MQRRGLFRANKVNTIPNTFIGGVAADIPDSATLATKLGIPESKIKSFEVVGNDIKAAINTTYNLSGNTFYNKAITYFKDKSKNVKNIVGWEFFNTTSLTCIELEGVETIGVNGFRNSRASRYIFPECTQLDQGVNDSYQFYLCSNAKVIYLPKCTQYGAWTDGTKPNVFFSIQSGVKIYADPSMATINNGSEEGDLAYARSRGCIITYVQNFTKPANITDLSYTTNGTDVTLNFTPPSSTNTLDFYEVYVNGCYKEEISGSGAIISGLSNGDKVTVYACDEYYNRSISNEVTISGI